MPVRTDPPVSQAQRAAMHAAASGKSTLGIPKSVGEEFSEADPGGKLPAHKDAAESMWKVRLFEKKDPQGKGVWTTVTVKASSMEEAKREAVRRNPDYLAGSAKRADGINHDPADITRLSERCDAIADSLREVTRRMDAAGGARADNWHVITEVSGYKIFMGLGPDDGKYAVRTPQGGAHNFKSMQEARKFIENHKRERKDAAGGEAEGKKLDAMSPADQKEYYEDLIKDLEREIKQKSTKPNFSTPESNANWTARAKEIIAENERKIKELRRKIVAIR